MTEMLQKNKNVANNVVNENSQDLTECWEKGELPEGHYYIKNNKKNEIEIDEYVQWYKDHGIPSEKSFAYFNVQQVLAPVPTFEELQNMNKAVNECMAANIKLVEQNAQLKEQINKCCLDAINRGTANTVKAVKEFGMPERIEELVKQNAILKELLKDCRLAIFDYPPYDLASDKIRLTNKIDEVLK